MVNKDLKNFVARVNNLIMNGNFSGDDIHEASFLMNTCMDIHNMIVEAEKKAEENSENKEESK